MVVAHCCTTHISLALRALRAPSVQSFGQVSTILDKKYPMWVMSIADFLELSQLPDAHLQLTTNGILAQQLEASRGSDRGRWTKSFFPLAIFVCLADFSINFYLLLLFSDCHCCWYPGMLRQHESGFFTIFVSHRWSSWSHPDPSGEKLAILQRMLQNLMDGSLEVSCLHLAQFPSISPDTW